MNFITKTHAYLLTAGNVVFTVWWTSSAAAPATPERPLLKALIKLFWLFLGL